MAEFPVVLAEKVVTAMVTDPASKFPSIIAQTQSELFDVVQAGLKGALDDWHEYEPVHNGVPIQKQTFIRQRAFSAAWDFLRKEGSEQRKQQRFAGTLKKTDKEQVFLDQLQDVYQAARTVGKQRRKWERRSSKGYTRAQYIAIGWIMRQKSLSTGAALMFMSKREDIAGMLMINPLRIRMGSDAEGNPVFVRRHYGRMFFSRARREFNTFEAQQIGTDTAPE